jgi:hypothetical protein
MVVVKGVGATVGVMEAEDLEVAMAEVEMVVVMVVEAMAGEAPVVVAMVVPWGMVAAAMEMEVRVASNSAIRNHCSPLHRHTQSRRC